MDAKYLMETVIEALEKYPRITHAQTDPHTLQIVAANSHGFTIILELDDYENTLYLDSFHLHYETDEEGVQALLEMLVRAITGFVRIKKYAVDGEVYKSTLQGQDEDLNWYDEETMALLKLKKTSHPAISYLQNEYQFTVCPTAFSARSALLLETVLQHKEQSISAALLALGITSFEEAASWVAQLPYRRNTDKEDVLIVCKEACGTCSTKHALLKRVAEENNMDGIRLMLGVFQLNARNAPALKDTLAALALEYLPEAHIYLRLEDVILDYTGLAQCEEDFSQTLMAEIEIQPAQINAFKVHYHKQYLQQWIIDTNSSYSLAALWEIRERCIHILAHERLQLTTRRLFMRPFQEQDAEVLMCLNDDPEVLQYTGDTPFESIADLQAFLRDYAQYTQYQVGRLLVIHRNTQEVLGWSGLKYDPQNKEYDIGYRFFKKYWSHGYATESAKACLDYGFRKLGLHRIIGRARAENSASIRVFEKLNMTPESTFVEDSQQWVRYSITNPHLYSTD